MSYNSDGIGKIYLGKKAFKMLCDSKGLIDGFSEELFYGEITFVYCPLLEDDKMATADPRLAKIMEEYNKAKE